MGIASKEEKVLELFFNEPTKHWHFSDILITANVSKRVASRWLSKYRNEQLIRHIKLKGKMPYFQGNWEHDNYRSRKKLYALQKLYETGLIQRLQKLNNAKAIIIFGSYVRSDWITGSDVDVFIYGDSEDLPYNGMWEGLGFQGKPRALQVHAFSTEKEIQDARGLIKNVLRGHVVKGDIFEILGVAAS